MTASRFTIQPDLDHDEYKRICDDGLGGGCTITQRLTPARARDVAAALNATEGLSTEELERGIVDAAFTALQNLTALLDADDEVVVGCHCITEHNDCAWCNAQTVLRRAGRAK